MTPGPLCYFGSGQQIDIFNFTRDQLDPALIGRALSRLNRFGGNGDRVMTVAQHSYNLSHLVGDCPHRQRAAIMHDVPEMWTGEIPRPVKRRCRGIEMVDHEIILRISGEYGIPMKAFDEIREMDTRISYDERLFMFDQLMPADRERAEANCLHIHIVPVTMEIAAESWTRRFHELFWGEH